jgi:hypothetical protein
VELTDAVCGVVSTIQELRNGENAPNVANWAKRRATGAEATGKGHTARRTARSGRFTAARTGSGAKGGKTETPAKLSFDEGSNVAYLAEEGRFELPLQVSPD